MVHDILGMRLNKMQAADQGFCGSGLQAEPGVVSRALAGSETFRGFGR